MRSHDIWPYKQYIDQMLPLSNQYIAHVFWKSRPYFQIWNVSKNRISPFPSSDNSLHFELWKFWFFYHFQNLGCFLGWLHLAPSTCLSSSYDFFKPLHKSFLLYNSQILSCPFIIFKFSQIFSRHLILSQLLISSFIFQLFHIKCNMRLYWTFGILVDYSVNLISSQVYSQL